MSDYPKWESMPACAGTDTEMWFCEDDETGYREKSLIQRICASCEVKEQCLNYSLHHSVHGFWAGTTPRERMRLRKERNIISTPIYSAWDLDE
jgi:WhiB family redox-sensing transcriptional regulator